MSAKAAVQLVAELERGGVRLRLAGDKIAFQPRHRVNAEQLTRLAALKPDVIALVRKASADAAKETLDQRTSICFACGGFEFWSAPGSSDRECAACHAPKIQRDQIGWSTVPTGWSSEAPPDVVCLSCLGHRFVRLKNGRRAVCLECERPQPDEIEGDDVGLIGGVR